MRAFRFGLEPVLKVRVLELKQSLAELHHALAALQQAQEGLEALHRRRVHTEDEFRLRLKSEAAFAELTTLTACLEQQCDAIVRQTSVVEQLSRKHQECVDAYLACRRRCEGIERLRDKAWRAYLHELAYKAQSEADEMAVRSASEASV